MPLINGALQIGRNAILTSQAALQVVGNNMANAATPSYSRQRVQLAPTQFNEVTPGKYSGTGVQILDIRRMVDDALNGRIRTANSETASFDVQQQALVRAEATFNELTNTDLSTRLSQFFASWERLQTEPSNATIRSNVLIEGDSLANYIRETRDDLFAIQKDLDAQVRFHVGEADRLATQIADLNEQVVTTEAGRPGSSAALRDQRDELLKELSGLMSITTQETEAGAVNVYLGNQPLVENARSRGVKFEEEVDGNGTLLSRVLFKDNDGEIDLTSGKIHGLLVSRDQHLAGLLSDLDDWTSALILEVNQLHALGQGQQGYAAVTSLNNVIDPDASLADTAATNLPWPVTNGVFNINIFNTDGSIKETRQINVRIGIDGNDTTVNSLIADINSQFTDITASLDGANHLHISTNSTAVTFNFSAPDQSSASNVLAVLGVNTYWQGDNAKNIEVSSVLDETHLAAATDGQATSGDIAGIIAGLANTGTPSLNGLSLADHFTNMIGRLGTDSRSAQDNLISADVVVKTLEAERQSVSGVSMDEEAVNLITFQRMMQGSSRYISIIDQMMDEVISLAR
jgi:flagellar hook-associated protein 1 FlgK